MMHLSNTMVLIFKIHVFVMKLGMIYTSGIITNTGEVIISKEDQKVAVTDAMTKCYQHILFDSYPKGLYCNRTFDQVACWPDTPPGVTQYQPCPNYIQGFNTIGNASRQCMPDGHWYVSPLTNGTWTNYSQCLEKKLTASVPELIQIHIEYIKLMYNTGYGLSFVSLILAVFIMLHFKRLHCPRNTVHVNLFVSFILRAIVSFLEKLLLVEGVGFSSDVKRTPVNTVIFIEDGMHWECKLLHTLFHYVLSANYMWILVEGLYLHTLVYVSVFSERSSIRWYYLLGWGTPFLTVIPWVAVRIAFENILCWNTNPTPGFLWILRVPIVLSLVINFIFFINILRALFTKLHKCANTASARHNRYRRLAKATLILIPLFGVHFIVFIGVPDNVEPTAEVVRLYFEMFFNSFQGFLVAVLFCFLNQEVQMEIRKTWYRWKSKPDPVYIQQSQYLADSTNGNARRPARKENVSKSNARSEKLSENRSEKHISSDDSTDTCLCKWTLDKNGRLRRSFIKTGSIKSKKCNKKLIAKETKM